MQISIDNGVSFIEVPEGTDILVKGAKQFNRPNQTYAVKLNDEGVMVSAGHPGIAGFVTYDFVVTGN